MLRTMSLGFLVDLPYAYDPSLEPVGSGSAYWPGAVVDDMRALNVVGAIGDDFSFADSFGSQADDMLYKVGAFDEDFREGVRIFQRAAGLTVDGWIGPNTRRALVAAVARVNAGTAPLPSPSPSPSPGPGPVPVLPVVDPVDPLPNDPEGLSTGAKIGIGLGVVGLLVGGAYVAFR